LPSPINGDGLPSPEKSVSIFSMGNGVFVPRSANCQYPFYGDGVPFLANGGYWNTPQILGCKINKSNRIIVRTFPFNLRGFQHPSGNPTRKKSSKLLETLQPSHKPQSKI